MARGRNPNPESKVVQFKSDDGVPPEERAAVESARLLPDFLSPDEVEIWERVAPELHMIGRLKGHFVDVLAEYCRAIARLATLRQQLKSDGEVYTTVGRNGTQWKSRPEVAQLNEAWRQWRNLAAALGLSPADERGLQIAQGDMFDNPFADLDR